MVKQHLVNKMKDILMKQNSPSPIPFSTETTSDVVVVLFKLFVQHVNKHAELDAVDDEDLDEARAHYHPSPASVNIRVCDFYFLLLGSWFLRFDAVRCLK